MSYTSSLKEDMLHQPLETGNSQRAQLSGILASCAKITFSDAGISFRVRTDSAAMARLIYSLSRLIFDFKPVVKTDRLGSHRRYVISFDDAYPVLEGCGILKRGNYWYSPIFQEILGASEKQQRFFLRGVFLGCGSMTNPEKSYHLELSTGAALADTVTELLSEFNIHAGMVKRKNQTVVYIKDSEQVSDFLRLIGAHTALMNFENTRISKEIRNDVNRQVNCETANLNKTISASRREIDAIEILKEKGDFDGLSEEMKKIASLRLSHPDASIGELLDNADFKISRSTLHRRLKKLVDLAAGEEK